MSKIMNPILTGFNPDPCIICVGDDYYIANSTFEYFPGVQIHHSKDLLNWELICRPLNSVNHLDMIGNQPSGGIWAPAISYCDGTFYLIFTDVKNQKGPFKDSHNYMTTATNILGPWSDPIYINSSGFDPSLFHDDDGRKWFINMEWDFRKSRGAKQFTGILMQEYDSSLKQLVGPVKKIFKGTNLRFVEGPHVIKKDGYYYLITAEGGTSYEHAITICRSLKIDGPYEVHPQNPLITSFQSNVSLQKAGHGNIMQAPNKKWYLSHLCGRPLPNTKRCVLGRETALQEIYWKDGWPYLVNGTNNPSDYFEVEANVVLNKKQEITYNFNNHDFLNDFQTLRIPYNEEMFSILDRPGYLRLKGRESLSSRHQQTVIVRRQEDFCFEVETFLEFKPTYFQQLAGLIYRYNEENQYYLYMNYNDELKQNQLNIMKFDKGNWEFSVEGNELCFNEDKIYLKLKVEYEKGQFYFSFDGNKFIEYGGVFDTSIISDDYADGFTGAFVGIAAQDLLFHKSYADFKYFKYQVLK